MSRTATTFLLLTILLSASHINAYTAEEVNDCLYLNCALNCPAGDLKCQEYRNNWVGCFTPDREAKEDIPAFKNEAPTCLKFGAGFSADNSGDALSDDLL